MNKEYFLPVNSVNISQYFTRGLIVPSKYIRGWINDVQAKYPNSILLSDKVMASETNCSLTIAFSKDELENIDKVSDSFYIYNKSLPISRVKKINFKDIKQAENTKYNIEQGNAFVPNLISILNSPSVANISELNNSKKIVPFDDWEEKNNFFNRLLGGVALMKIATGNNYIYPESYFNTLSFLNVEIKNQIKHLSFINDFSFYLKYKEKTSDVYKIIDVNYVIEYARKNNILDIKVKRGLIRVDEIDWRKNKNSYLLAILATYGADFGKMKKISDFIASLMSGNFGVEVKEELCLLFGINQGYDAFNNQYNIQDAKVDVKFKLDSELDYSLIESVYQYVFNDKKDNTTFPYINEWCPKFTNDVDLRKYETYRVFDKDIRYKKKAKIGSAEYFQELYQKFFEDSVLATIFNSLKGSVTDSINAAVKSVFDKVKSDIEIENKFEFESVLFRLKKETQELRKSNNQLMHDVESLKKNNDLLLEKEKESENNYFELNEKYFQLEAKNIKAIEQKQATKTEFTEATPSKELQEDGHGYEDDKSQSEITELHKKIDFSKKSNLPLKDELSRFNTSSEEPFDKEKYIKEYLVEVEKLNAKIAELERQNKEIDNELKQNTEAEKNTYKFNYSDVDVYKIVEIINSISDLREIANKLDIANTKRFKNNDEDKKELKEKIVEKIKHPKALF